MSKTKQVLYSLLNGQTVTSYEAFKKFQATRLSAIIFCLRQRGYNIKDYWQEVVEENAVTKYKVYYLDMKEPKCIKNTETRKSLLMKLFSTVKKSLSDTSK